MNEKARLSDIGEKLFLKKLLPHLDRSENFLNGFGHDSSIVDLGLEKNIAFKIDRAPFPLTIKRGWGGYETWGRLAVVANVSDLLATGATPQAFMLSMVLPRDFGVCEANRIVEGVSDACSQFGISFVGGDTKEGTTPQVVGSAIGTVDRDYYLGRTAANPGDKLVIAGLLGGFSGALALADKFGSKHPKFGDWIKLLNTPSPQLREATTMTISRVARSSCDISDGLADVLQSLCSSGVGITLNSSQLPLHPFACDAQFYLNMTSSDLAFSVGDWAIAYVIPGNQAHFLKPMFAIPDLCISIIGQFNDTGLRLIEAEDGSLCSVPTTINEHFVSRLEDK